MPICGPGSYLAQFSTSNPLRGWRPDFGTLSIGKLGKLELQQLKAMQDQITVVNYDPELDGSADTFGHSYFRDNPAVSSDLVLRLRYGYEAGSPGRPLENVGLTFWRIPANYPANAKLN